MKAVSGKVIATIVTLVLAILSLVVLWIFLSKSTPYIIETVQKVVCSMCKTILPDIMCGKC